MADRRLPYRRPSRPPRFPVDAPDRLPDSPAGSAHDRAAEECVAPGGIIVVDDSWRYRQLRDSARAGEVQIFESVGPGRFGVTSTDVFLYR